LAFLDLALFGFVWLCFSGGRSRELSLYPLVMKAVTFIWSSRNLALFCIKSLICRDSSTSVEENLKFKVENVKPQLKM